MGCPMSPWLFNIFLDVEVRVTQSSFWGEVRLGAW